MSLDPLEALRLAWQQESTPPLDEDLGNADLDTQAKVRALQEVWKQQTVELEVDLSKIRHRYRRGQRSSTLFKLVPRGAIAALACAAGLLVWVSRSKTLVESTNPLNSTTVSSVDTGPLVPDSLDTPRGSTLASAQEPSIRVLPREAITYRKDGIELVSGSVRLVLVQPSTSKTQ